MTRPDVPAGAEGSAADTIVSWSIAMFYPDTSKVVEQVRRANSMLVFICVLVFITLRAIPPVPEHRLPELSEFEQLFRYEGLRVRQTMLDEGTATVLMLVLKDPPEKFLLHVYPLFSLAPLADDAPLRDLRDRWDVLLRLPVFGLDFAPYVLVDDQWKQASIVPPSQGYYEPPEGLPTTTAERSDIFANLHRARQVGGRYRDNQHPDNDTPEAAVELRFGAKSVVLFFSATQEPVERIPALERTLREAEIANYRKPLTEFAEYFPFVEQQFERVADLPLDRALIVLGDIVDEVRDSIALRLEDEPPVSVFGLQIPRTDVVAFGSVLVVLLQLYFFLHLSAMAQSISRSESGALAPWVGIYDQPLARATYLFSVAAPPLIVQITVMTVDLPVKITSGTAWLVYSWSTLLVSIALVLASIAVTSRIWKRVTTGAD